jgi:hypothetical protein
LPAVKSSVVSLSLIVQGRLALATMMSSSMEINSIPWILHFLLGTLDKAKFDVAPDYGASREKAGTYPSPRLTASAGMTG